MVNSLIILVDFSIENDTPQGTMSICFCMHPYECIHYALCIVHLMYNMQLVYCILYFVFCMSNFINNLGWLFPSKMTPRKAQCALCIVHLMYNMQLVYCIMYLHYAWVNLFIILVDFSHQKWHPTMDNVHLFCYACIVHYVACMRQYAISLMHYVWMLFV